MCRRAMLNPASVEIVETRGEDRLPVLELRKVASADLK